MVQPLIAVRHPVRLVRVDTSGWTSVARRAPSGENGCPVAHLITPVTAEDITGAVAGTAHMFQAGLGAKERMDAGRAHPLKSAVPTEMQRLLRRGESDLD